MESIGHYVVNKVVDYIATTTFGQFFIKKIDKLFWSIEQVGQYNIQEDNKAKNVIFVHNERRLPWLIFWTLMINLHIFRVVTSMILVKFNKKPIESKNIVENIQKWRRFMRSIRFKGLKKIREQKYGSKEENGETTNESDLSITPSNKKRHHDEMIDDEYDSHVDWINQTCPETDDLDSTYVPSEKSLNSSSSSSNEEHFESPSKDDNSNKHQNNDKDTKPADQSSEGGKNSTLDSTKSNDIKSADEKADSSSLNEAIKTEKNLSGSKFWENLKDEKATNQYSDPTDVLISKLVSISNGHKTT